MTLWILAQVCFLDVFVLMRVGGLYCALKGCGDRDHNYAMQGYFTDRPFSVLGEHLSATVAPDDLNHGGKDVYRYVYGRMMFILTQNSHSVH